MPFLLEAAAVLAAFVHPNHIVYLCSWGFTHLPPTCNFKLFGYRREPRISLEYSSKQKHSCCK
ncbi:hypothetical protein D8T43_20395 [Vibrio vulnificus]|nr:hypothetical protein CRN45_21800 [Vibrio vulnificus]POC64357.1 hypothetical protein CRN44_08440 [Vibrio vulnificus]RZR04362.1 hypothetical protein D8T43_20395 [Vibrio vulnificus]